GDWAERLRLCFLSAHDQVAPYAGLAARMARDMPSSFSAQRVALYLAELLDEANIDSENAARIVYATFTYCWGHLLGAETGGMRGVQPARMTVTNIMRLWENVEGDRAIDLSRQQFLWGLAHLLDSFRQIPPRGRRNPRLNRAESGQSR